jgi:hypothetical protein
MDACRRGDPEVILTVPAKVAATLHGVFPGLAISFSRFMNWLLPNPGGIGTASAKGRDSQTAITSSFLTSLNRRAGQANNEA